MTVTTFGSNRTGHASQRGRMVFVEEDVQVLEAASEGDLGQNAAEIIEDGYAFCRAVACQDG